MRFSRHQLLALILGAGMTAVLPAQTRPTPPSPPPARGAAGARGMAAAMRRGGPAQALIRQRAEFNLTDEQVTQLQALEASDRPSQATTAELLSLRHELQLASKGEANLAAVRATMEKVNKIETDMMVARLDARNKARGLLTAEQQVQFDAIEAKRPMEVRGAGQGPDGPPNRPNPPRAGTRRGPPPPTTVPPTAPPATN